MAESGMPLAGLVLAGMLALVASTSANAAAFANGSFEQGNGIDTQLNAQSNAINSWRVYFGNIDYVSNNVWDAAQGDRSIDLNGNAPGGISQQFDVNALHNYKLEFSLSGNPDGHGNTFGARGNKTLTIYACSGIFVNLFVMNQGAPNNCDSQGANFAYDTSVQGNTRKPQPGMKYANESLTFQTKLGQESLFVVSTYANSPFGPVVDNFRLTDEGGIDMPEPASLVIVGTALAGFALRRRLKQVRPG